MKKIETRKTIALISIAVLTFVVIYCILTRKEIPQSSMTIITAMIGYIGYYFGKATALEMPKEKVEDLSIERHI
ncbi:MAG: hypothetical protein H7Y41_05020 [Hyphomonadaceae bacterium]|nr:hypothetical protein [Clostridia bacterium]